MTRSLMLKLALLSTLFLERSHVQQNTPHASSAAGQEVIENVTVIDGRGGEPLADAVLLVDHGRIRAIGKRGEIAIPTTAQRVDGGGGFLLPGFIDVHAHVALGPVRVDTSGPAPTMAADPDPGGSRRTLALLLAHGITTARDPGGPAAQTVALRDSVARGELPGPRLFVAGEVIDRTTFKGLTARVTTPEEVRAEVRRQAAAGVDVIKLYATLTPELVGAGIDEAHRLGLPAIAHVMPTTWTEAAHMGLDGIVHILGWSPALLPEAARPKYAAMMTGSQFMYGWLELADLNAREMRDAIDALAQRHVILDPTLVVFERAVRGDDPAITQSPALALASPALVENWRAFFNFNFGWSADDYRRARAAWPTALRLTKLLFDSGVTLAAGTDANNPWTVPGESFHRELELLVDAGISPIDVLTIATRNGAKTVGMLDETGTVEIGKRADLVLLRENPLRSIGATRSIAWVMKDGVRYDPKQLQP
ncbi:MAG: amidohydrolase family protein [Longimicrobiales bacterium]